MEFHLLDFATAKDPDRDLACHVAYDPSRLRFIFRFNEGAVRELDEIEQSHALRLSPMRIAMGLLRRYDDYEPYQASRSLLM